MSFLQKLFPWAFPKSASARKPRYLIIDAAPLCTTGRNDSGISPADQINGLRRLSRFVEREKVEACVVFDSEPLRKVGHGDKFDDITVYFTGKGGNLTDLTVKLAKDARARREAVVVTADRRLEEAVIDSGSIVMRMSTFRKALDGGGARGEDEPRRSPGGGNQRRRPQQNRGRNRSQSQDSRPRAEKASAGGTVHDLIDVVD